MKPTKRKNLKKRLLARDLKCQVCGQASASRFDSIGRPICNKNHSKKKKRR